MKEEALMAIQLARSFGSHFLFLSTNVDLTANLLPVLEEQGMLGSGWQILASETAIVFDHFPVGFMRWKPVSRGPRFAEFMNHWAKMRAADVVSSVAKDRYKIDKFRVTLDEAIVPPITDSTFSIGDAGLDVYSTFYFDAAYAFVFAINALLNKGIPISEIKGQALLQELRITEFEGISGFVSFDSNGDRKTVAYEMENMQPEGWMLVGTFSTFSGQLTLEGATYWMDGSRTALPPANLFRCDAGRYKEEESGQCKECKKGFQCENGVQELCPKGQFSNVTGSTSCRPCEKGSFSEDLGATKCTICVAGFFAERPGMHACERCPKGSYTPVSQSETCIPCGLGQVTEESGSQSISECRCAEGLFMCNASTGAGCLPCPEGLFCEAGVGLPVHQPGFWATDSSTCAFRVLRCRNDMQCPRRPLGECADGREGLACNNCRASHYPRDDGSCAECTSIDILPAILSIVVALLLFLLCLGSSSALPHKIMRQWESFQIPYSIVMHHGPSTRDTVELYETMMAGSRYDMV